MREMAGTFNHQQPWRILYVGETLPFPESWTLWASGWQNSTATWLLWFNVSVNHWWPWRIFECWWNFSFFKTGTLYTSGHRGQ